MEAKIIFNSETEMTVEQNGTCFIVDEKPEFPETMELVEVRSEEPMSWADARLVECASVDGRYWFSFITEGPMEKTIRELKEENEMLTDCILEMSEIIYAE